MITYPDDGGLAWEHGRALLTALGVRGDPAPRSLHPALAWQRSGLMAVTGRTLGPELVAPAAVTSAAEGALAALRSVAPSARLPEAGWPLLGERARLLALTRQGRISANGTCRLIATADGFLALSLARPDDWDCIPALMQSDCRNWAAIERVAASASRDVLVARGRDLGLPIAPSPAAPSIAALPAPFTVEQLATPRAPRTFPLVVDLSSLWAGPLAASLLLAAGAQVVKVESLLRPDGARGGNRIFFDLLNAGKRSVTLDFRSSTDLDVLRALIDRADIVIEASRPRALAQLGIDARKVAQRGAVWLSITAYGREGDAAEWVGFGDDVAVAGGMAAVMDEGWGEPLFAGDAIADPLTGVTAALAAWTGWQGGGGRLISVPMAGVVAHALALYRPRQDELEHWQGLAEADQAMLVPLRKPRDRTRPQGADTQWAREMIGRA